MDLVSHFDCHIIRECGENSTSRLRLHCRLIRLLIGISLINVLLKWIVVNLLILMRRFGTVHWFRN